MKLLTLILSLYLVKGEIKRFEGPFTGELNSGTTELTIVDAERDTCILNNIKSCNSSVQHTASWCFL